MENNQSHTEDPARLEQNLVNRIAWEAIAEQRRARRWGIFFKLLFALYVLVFLLLYLPPEWTSSAMVGQKHTALVDIDGVISQDTEANADYVVTGLRRAFEDENTAGVILRINSPGGSPVQAGYIYDEIKRLRDMYPEIPLYAVITDICASGGYYIAAAADEIYANKASVVGSIGVVMSGFGFVDAIDKLGIERRLLTAGENKGFLDPFSPLKESDVEHVNEILHQVYQQFIDIVKAGRGDRLKDDDRLYSGLIWTGEQSMELGLVDALGSAGYVAREVIGAEKIIDYTLHDTYFQQFAKQLTSAFFGGTGARLELK